MYGRYVQIVRLLLQECCRIEALSSAGGNDVVGKDGVREGAEGLLRLPTRMEAPHLNGTYLKRRKA